MMHDSSRLTLHPHQAAFVDQFLARNDARTLLIAAPGTGKTVTARVAAMRMLDEELADRILFVAGHRALSEHWKDTWPHGAGSGERPANSLATTYAALAHDLDRVWGNATPGTRWLFLFDEIDRVGDQLDTLAETALARFPGSRALFVGH